MEITCYNCGKLILPTDDLCIDIFSDENGEDICLACYAEYVEPFEIWSEDEQEVIGYKEVA
jgi:uncharacterized OB-fold protein